MRKHVIIIGGGVIGRCTAYYSALRGHRITLIERNPPDHPGCSFGNAGFITPSHFVPLAAPGMVALGLKWMLSPESPFYVKPRFDKDLVGWGWKFYRAANRTHVERAAPLLRDMNIASRACYNEIAAVSHNDFCLAGRGCLMLCNTERKFEEEKQGALEGRRLGLAADILNAEDVATLEPGVRMSVVGAVHFLDDAHFIPDRFMATMRRLLDEQQVECKWGTEVTGWKLNGNRIDGVRTTSGDITGDEYVVAGGSWTPRLVKGLDVNLPMQAGKGYSLTLTKPRQLPSIPAIGTEARLAITPMNGALRFGGTMEVAGYSEAINPARIRGILKSIPKYYPDFTADDFRDIQPWCGLRPLSPDGLPYVGRCGQYTNLSVGTGHAMLGMSMGPITGRLLAETLTGERPSIDMNLLSPDRYL